MVDMKRLLLATMLLLVIFTACGSDTNKAEDAAYINWLNFCETLLDDMEEATYIFDHATTNVDKLHAVELVRLADEYYIKNDCPE
jgi:hypothetical protein